VVVFTRRAVMRLAGTQQLRSEGASMENRLYVRNLTRDVAASSLQELFEPHGFVMDVKLASNAEAGGRGGYAVVTMATDQAAETALKALNGVTFHGAAIRIEIARADEEKGQTGTRREFVVHVPKRNPRQEYRLKQRQQIEASPFMAEKFPKLKSLKVTLEYYTAPGATKNGEMKCKLNVKHAKSALWFACPGGECVGGDFNLSDALASAASGRRKMVTGELRCHGTRKRADREQVPCQTLLRYKLNLNYD
jgi:hypothetical protein